MSVYSNFDRIRAICSNGFSGIIAWALLCAAYSHGGILTGPAINSSNGHIYYLLTQDNWSASEMEAVSLGGHLVTINDADENAWIVSAFSNFGGVPRALWIGMNDAAVEGSFLFVSGEPVGYTNWGPSEPNNAASGVGEDWVHIFPPNDTAGRFPKWNDAPNVSNAFGFIFNGVVEVAAVPEPSTFALVALVLLPFVGRSFLWFHPR